MPKKPFFLANIFYYDLEKDDIHHSDTFGNYGLKTTTKKGIAFVKRKMKKSSMINAGIRHARLDITSNGKLLDSYKFSRYKYFPKKLVVSKY